MEAERGARRRKGCLVYAETTPHYLTLTSRLYDGDSPWEFIITPPLRESCDIDALWDGVLGCGFQVIATDHCSFTREEKAEGTSCFDTLPGIPGVETLLPLVYHEGVVKQGMPLSELVGMLSSDLAKLFGLYLRKGVIIEDADADTVILDPDLTKTITSRSQHSKAGYSPYEGMTVLGYPSTVLLLGEAVCDNGRFQGVAGTAKFVDSKGRLCRD